MTSYGNKLKRDKKLKFGKNEHCQGWSTKFSIDQCIPRHSKINIY